MLQQIAVYVIGVAVIALIVYRMLRIFFFNKRKNGVANLCSCCPQSSDCDIARQLRDKKGDLIDDACDYGCGAKTE